MTRHRLKVCCIQDLAEAELAIRHGASLLGLVSAMPSGPGPISEEQIAEIASAAPPGVTTVLLTCASSVPAIIDQQRRCRTNAVQLVDELPEGSHRALREALPGIGLIQVIHVSGPESVEEARRVEPFVDALLLDSGNPKATIKELGGTGRVHNWSVSRQIVTGLRKPVFLAGGLRADNIADAAQRVDPFGFDVCSGVRSDGKLDERKLRALIAALPSANGS
jgi:phosphoribosylanthranilate isomerase